MKMIPDQVINAISDMLVLSLELGTLLAAAAGLMVLSTRRSTARFRYNLLVFGLGTFVFGLVFIFVRQLFSTQINLNFAAAHQVAPFATGASQLPVHSGYFDSFLTQVRVHANGIVLVWLLIVLARAIQLLTGLQSLYFLRRRHTSPLSKAWEERVIQIAAALGISRMVYIAESGMAKMPMVIGHLKPIILIPAGMITGLPPASIEAILVHELAHIRRADYLVNLLISSLEVIFFFNPAVLWVAVLIRAERENCCDDIAVAYTGSKKEYITALVACQEYQSAVPAYAMAFSGRKDHLLGRVKRMLSNSNSSLNIFERTILGFTLLTAVLFTAAFSSAGKIGKLAIKAKQAAGNVVNPAKVTLPVKFVLVERTKIKLNDTPQRADTSKIRIYKPEQVGDNTNVMIKNGSLQSQLVKIDGILYQVNRSDHIISLQVNGNTVASGEQQRYLHIIEQSKPVTAPVAQVARPAVPAVVAKPAPSVQDYVRQGQAYAANPYPKDVQPYHDGNNRDKLTADLIADGIIKKPEDLSSFKLSDSEFIVNGEKLPDDVHLKFKKAYVPPVGFSKKGSWSWQYNYSEK